MPVDEMTRSTTRHAGGQRDYVAVCTVCGQETGLPAYGCAGCTGPIVLQLARLRGSALQLPKVEATGIWRQAHLLPRTTAAVSLSEGATPLLPLALPRPAAATGEPQCWLKCEHLNPTLSFKDRAMALGVSMALDQQASGLVLASSGNAAASAAAYATAAGLPCRIFCGTSSAANNKIAVAEAFRAEVTLIDGDYSAAYAAALAAVKDGWVNVTTTYLNPALAEAYRTIATEIVADLGDAPGLVVVPIGAGPLLHGLSQGFRDIFDAGDSSRLPRMVGVQAEACAFSACMGRRRLACDAAVAYPRRPDSGHGDSRCHAWL